MSTDIPEVDEEWFKKARLVKPNHAKFHFWHKWTKWEPYVWRGKTYGSSLRPIPEGLNITEQRQRRYCMICGKSQDIKIAEDGA